MSDSQQEKAKKQLRFTDEQFIWRFSPNQTDPKLLEAIFVGRESLLQNVVEKIATALAMPAGLLWLLMLTLCIQLWRQNKQTHAGRPGAVAATCCFLLYSIAGNGIVADQWQIIYCFKKAF